MSQTVYVVIRHNNLPHICYTTLRYRAMELAGIPSDTILTDSDLDGHPSYDSEDGNIHVIEIENDEGEYDGSSPIWVCMSSDMAVIRVTCDFSSIDPSTMDDLNGVVLAEGMD